MYLLLIALAFIPTLCLYCRPSMRLTLMSLRSMLACLYIPRAQFERGAPSRCTFTLDAHLLSMHIYLPLLARES
ncbi:hypothetical protein PENSPDRAFT_317145 [Peniophora sp. CONT]|nr:hypothetical protein PENSPDRAFT_317145 [Peniophora sp. CONT]